MLFTQLLQRLYLYITIIVLCQRDEHSRTLKRDRVSQAGIVELVNTIGLGPMASSRAGSSPAIRICVF